MIAKIIPCEQYDDDWWDARKGVFTASIASKVITPTGKMSRQYRDELGRMIAEHMEWQDQEEQFSTQWMDRGSEMEDEALAWFAVETNLPVERVGFIKHDTQPFGCSPDAIYFHGALAELIIPIEIKCPKPSTHIKWLLDGGLPDAHKAQVHFQMALTGAPFAYFMSYHPEMQPLLVKVDADDYTENLIHYLDKVADEFGDAFELITGEEWK